MDLQITMEQAKKIGDQIGADWTKIELGQFQSGLLIEAGNEYFKTDNTYENTLVAARIILSHLNEIPDYYTRLLKMKEKAKREWRRKNKYAEIKEQHTKSVLLLRDQIADWKNKVENFSREIAACDYQLQEITSSEMKKRVAKKAVKFEELLKREVKKMKFLKERIYEFDQRAEAEISRGKEKLRARIVKESGKLGNRVQATEKYFDEVNSRFSQFLEEAKKVKAESETMVEHQRG